MVSDVDRNVIFGIRALQLGYVKQGEFIDGIEAWVKNKDRSLREVFIQQNSLKPKHWITLDRIVADHIAEHGDNALQSVAASSTFDSIREHFGRFHDPDVQASIGVATTNASINSDFDATIPPAIHVEPTPTDSRYRKHKEPFAKGNLGVLFNADDTELNRIVALKEIKDEHADKPESRTRFELEAQVTGGLEHPGIVPVYSLGHNKRLGRPYYAMRKIKGKNLEQELDEYYHITRDQITNKVTSPPRKMDAHEYESVVFRSRLGKFIGICQALAYAHSRRILHRDLKPSNIMLGHYGETLVVDWGLAKVLGAGGKVMSRDDEPPLQPTAKCTPEPLGAPAGTPAFMSPEQANGQWDTIEPSSDVYGLGAILFAVLSGLPPVSGQTVNDVLDRVKKREIEPLRQLQPSLPKALESVCLKALALRPDDRYVSAQELAEDLDRWLADEPVRAWSEPLAVRSKRWIRRHSRLAVGSVTAITVALMSLAAFGAERANHNRAIEEQTGIATLASGLIDGVIMSNDPLDFLESDTIGAGVSGERSSIELALKRASQGFEQWDLTSQPEVAMRLLTTLGKTYRSIGDFGSARTHLGKSEVVLSNSRKKVSLAEATRLDFELGQLSLDSGDYAQSEKCFNRVLNEQLKMGAPDSAVLRTKIHLAWALGMMNSPRAEVLLRRLVVDCESSFGTNNPYTIMVRIGLVAVLYEQNRGEEAVKHLLKLNVDMSQLTNAHQRTVGQFVSNCQNALLIEYGALKLPSGFRKLPLEKAKALLHKSIVLGETAFGDKHVYLAFVRYFLADLHVELGDVQEADREYRKVMAIVRDAHLIGHPKLAVVADAYAAFLKRNNRESEGRVFYRELATDYEKQSIAGCVAHIHILLAHARFELASGKTVEADRLIDEASQWYSAKPTSSDLVLITRMLDLADRCRERQRLKAVKSLLECVRLFQTLSDEMSISERVAFKRLSCRLHMQNGDSQRAEDCLLEAETIGRTIPSPLNDDQLTYLAVTRGDLEACRGEFRNAEAAYRKAYQICVNFAGRIWITEVSEKLAGVLADQTRYADALPLALRMQQETSKGKANDVSKAQAIALVASLHLICGKTKEHFECVKNLVDQFGGSNDPEVLMRVAIAAGLSSDGSAWKPLEIAKRLELAIQGKPTYPWWQRSLAYAYARAGEWKSFERVSKGIPEPRLPIDHALEALVAVKRGDGEAARRYLAATKASTAWASPNKEKPLAYHGFHWWDRLQTTIIVEEAEALTKLLEQKPKAP